MRFSEFHRNNSTTMSIQSPLIKDPTGFSHLMISIVRILVITWLLLWLDGALYYVSLWSGSLIYCLDSRYLSWRTEQLLLLFFICLWRQKQLLMVLLAQRTWQDSYSPAMKSMGTRYLMMAVAVGSWVPCITAVKHWSNAAGVLAYHSTKNKSFITSKVLTVLVVENNSCFWFCSIIEHMNPRAEILQK